MIRRGLYGLKRTAIAAFRLAVPVQRRDIATDASLLVPFAPGSTEPIPLGMRVAVMCHLFHTDLCGLILDAVSNIGHPTDLLISTDTSEKRRVIEEAFADWLEGTLTIRVVENRGRDIAPKLITFSDIYASYDLVLFLHTKKSHHYEHGDAWRDGLFRSLVGSRETVSSIVQIFTSQPSVGMVIAQHFEPIREWIFWNGNFLRAWKLARRMGFSLPLRRPIDFPSGSMFWARPEALRPLIDLDLRLEEFPFERGQINKTFHHAIERLLLFACEHAGFGWVKVSDRSAMTGSSPRHAVERSGDVAEFLKRHSWSVFPTLGQGRVRSLQSRVGTRSSR